MADIPLGALAGALVLLLLISAFFSGSETALMTLNRYRLRHLADAGHPGARLAARLLEQPDRLIGLILLGNNLVNILASAIATVMALRVGGEGALAIATGLLTLVVLIFAEVTPKTFAALYPERLAFPAAIIYTGAMIPQRHKKMLLGILDLEQATVEDIMIPRNDIDGVDIEQPLDDVLDDLEKTPYTRVLVYRGSLDNVVGFLHARRVMQLMLHEQLSRERLETLIREPYFIPEGTPLNRQLINFQRENRRVGIVVDEYGDVHGLLTIGDLLEEIVGQFTTDPSDEIASVQPQDDGSFLVDGGAGVRELVRNMHWELPTDGPRTLNGLIVEQLESIPEPGISLLVAGYPVEIIQTQGNAVKTARIRPADRREATPEA
ncbi:MAG: CNNM domain-containing protein [Gammaproteobacteria bacterium]